MDPFSKVNARGKQAPTSRLQKMEIIPLGSGAEVGRSCHILRYKGKTVMLDCGMHPGYSGAGALPFFDEVDPGEIDLLLITHFHLDHAAGLPYFTEKTAFKGRIFMTHPTKAVLKMMITDSLRVSDDMLFDSKDLDRCLAKVELIGLHQAIEVNGIKFSCYNAGHVLGASMFKIEIAGIRTLYTGDYTRTEDRHLMAAEIPSKSPEVLICEATLGKHVLDDREKREMRFIEFIEGCLRRGGRCLIPMFALGRAQEIMLILEEHWEKHPELQKFPIYYVTKMADRALRVYQTFVNVMNSKIRKQTLKRNPFKFKHIHQLRNIRSYDDDEPCVFLASPGMLQSGASRQLFERWCPDPRNLCLIPGYSVDGTLAKTLLDSSPDKIVSMDGRTLERNCQIEYIPFIAHADFAETSEFVKRLQPTKIVLVHGEESGMRSLAKSLAEMMKHKTNIEVLTPRNTEIVKFKFDRDKIAKIIGKLADMRPEFGSPVKGLFVTENFVHHVISAEDIPTYTRLSINKIKQRLHIPYQNKYEILKLFLSDVFDLSFIPVLANNSKKKGKKKLNPMPIIFVSSCVRLTHSPPDRVLLEWDASPVNDMVADAVATIVLQAATSPASVALTSTPCPHTHDHDHTMTSNAEDLKEKQLQILYVLRKSYQEYYFDLSVKLLDDDGSYIGENKRKKKKKSKKKVNDNDDEEAEAARQEKIESFREEYKEHFETFYRLTIEGKHLLAMCNLKSARYLIMSLDPEVVDEDENQEETEKDTAIDEEGDKEGGMEVETDEASKKDGDEMNNNDDDAGEEIPVNIKVVEHVLEKTLIVLNKQMFDYMKHQSDADYHDTEKEVEPDYKVKESRNVLTDLNPEEFAKYGEDLYMEMLDIRAKEIKDEKKEGNGNDMDVDGVTTTTTTTTTTTPDDDIKNEIFNIYETDNPDVLKVFEEETDETLCAAIMDIYKIDDLTLGTEKGNSV